MTRGWRFAYIDTMQNGRARLRTWIERSHFGSQKEAADVLGFDHTFLSQILNGHRQPGLRNAVAIERVTGIPVAAWVPTGEGESAEPVVAGARNRRSGKA